MSVVTAALKSLPLTNNQLLVACSGGVDSMVLLHALLTESYPVSVLHVNYGLRGAESDADEQLVRKICIEAGVDLQVIHCNEQELRAPGVNLQAAAREIRRNAFKDWINRSPKHKVVVAQHANDQLETFFLQLFRGSGTFGLGGMHEEREGIFRPFLSLRKSDLIGYALENKVVWREDRSNASSYYLRNFFRNELLPVLKASDPDLQEKVMLLMRVFRERQSELLAEVAPEVRKWKAEEILSCQTWLNWTDDQRLAFLKCLNWPVWVSPRLTKLAVGRTGACVEIGDQRICKVTKATLGLENKQSKNDWDFKIETIEILPLKFDKNTIYLDAEKLSGTLFFRSRRTGDRIRSLGITGSQLVSDVLKDAGIALTDRENIPVLTDGKRILWIPGIKISREAIATETSKKILVVSLVNYSF